MYRCNAFYIYQLATMGKANRRSTSGEREEQRAAEVPCSITPQHRDVVEIPDVEILGSSYLRHQTSIIDTSPPVVGNPSISIEAGQPVPSTSNPTETEEHVDPTFEQGIKEMLIYFKGFKAIILTSISFSAKPS